MSGAGIQPARRCEHTGAEPKLLAVFDEYRIGMVSGHGIVDISECFQGWRPAATAIRDCIAEWPTVSGRVDQMISSGRLLDLAEIHLRPPVPEPRNLLCAPVNYHEHRGEVTMDRRGEATATADVRDRGFFVKSISSIVGPGDPIELPPLEQREFAYEGEVALVVGSPLRGRVDPNRAWDYVFGLTGFVDVTLRPSETRIEERSMRKSYHSFGPLGPWIMVTETEPDVDSIALELTVNGITRQSALLGDLITPIPGLLSSASQVLPLTPGDVFATGTPSGVGPLAAGDVVTLHVCPIGEMSLTVTEREW